ncbi:LuxR C-terminal-related transcriptional regulator [Hyphomonas sp.]|uniref:helix-turn-helix transcriptional regulator n=1 Tax=Hyphomonas sp. TaxID=87 RepID=UPI003527DDFB
MLELLRAILKAETVFGLSVPSMAAFNALGFTRAYYLTPIVMDRTVGPAMFNLGYPAEWEEAYRNAPKGSDPLPFIALRIGRPFRWGKLPGTLSLQPSEIAYIKSLEKWGMSDGIGIPVYGSAARVGFVGISGPKEPDGLETADMELLWVVAETSYLRYCELIVADAEPVPRLSSRELDVLHQMAEGKSNASIARNLDLSQETVDTYARRIFLKLNVSDRTSAVIKGVSRGIVIASEPQIEKAIRDRHPDYGVSKETE